MRGDDDKDLKQQEALRLVEQLIADLKRARTPEEAARLQGQISILVVAYNLPETLVELANQALNNNTLISSPIQKESGAANPMQDANIKKLSALNAKIARLDEQIAQQRQELDRYFAKIADNYQSILTETDPAKVLQSLKVMEEAGKDENLESQINKVIATRVAYDEKINALREQKGIELESSKGIITPKILGIDVQVKEVSVARGDLLKDAAKQFANVVSVKHVIERIAPGESITAENAMVAQEQVKEAAKSPEIAQMEKNFLASLEVAKIGQGAEVHKTVKDDLKIDDNSQLQKLAARREAKQKAAAPRAELDSAVKDVANSFAMHSKPPIQKDAPKPNVDAGRSQAQKQEGTQKTTHVERLAQNKGGNSLGR